MGKFTKEELETVGKFMDEWKYYSPPISLSDYLDQCKKPETKKIVVEIEYDDFNNNKIGAGDVKTAIENYSLSSHWNFKVTELPQVFSREDMIALGDKIIYNIQCNHQIYPYNEFGNNNLENFLSERKK